MARIKKPRVLEDQRIKGKVSETKKTYIDKISDDLQTVTVSNLENPEESKTISTSYFDGITIVGALYKKITGLLFRKGGKRTQKKRRTNKKRKN